MVGHLRHRPSATRLSLESLEPRRLLAADLLSPASLAKLDGFGGVQIEQAESRTSFLGLAVETSGFTPTDAGASTAANAFLSTNQAVLGLPADAVRELEARSVKHGLASSHVRYQQVSDGLEVLGGEVTVHFNDRGAVTTVHNRYRDVEMPADQIPDFPAHQAIQIAEQHAGITETFGSADYELAWWPQEDGSADLVWDIMVYGYAPFGNFQTRVDAETGELISQDNLAAAATGTGWVFEANPFQMKGDGNGLEDDADANSPELQAQLRSVELQGLDDGTGLLRGEYVDLVSINNPAYADPDADEPSRIYEYDRADPRFEQVNIYHAIDQAQRYIQSLGYSNANGNGIRDYPTFAVAHFGDFQNAFYTRLPNEFLEDIECPSGFVECDMVVFGDGNGGIDLGEDPDVVLHEYGHAIQHDQNPAWGGGEMGAMGEGFSDYLAASLLADVGDPGYLADHAPAIAEWAWLENSLQYPPSLRRVDGNKVYPDDLVGQVHADGEIWSAALWDIRGEIGSDVLDPILLESHFALPGEALMRDGANAIIQADMDINGGANQGVLEFWFQERGILSSPAPDDHGNSADLATQAIVPSLATGLIDSVADIDYFSFFAQQGFAYQFETELITLADSVLVLFDTDGVTPLATDDDGGVGLASLINWTAPASGTYFLRVDNYSNEIGGYNLDLRLESFEDYLEDNDFIAQATPLVSGDQTWHQLTIDKPADDDFFRMTAAADGTLDVHVLFEHDGGDIDLEVLDSNGIAQASSTSGDNNEQVSLAVTADETYYIRVFGHAGAISENYTLQIDAPGDVDLNAFDFNIEENGLGFDEFGPGQVVDVFYDFENLGDGGVAGSNFEVGFYLSLDDVIDPANDWFVDRAAGVDLTPGPGPGAVFNDTIQLTLPDASSPFWEVGNDTYYLGMFIDDLQSQDELSELNNALWDDFELIIPEDHLEQDDTILDATLFAPGMDIDEMGLTIDQPGDDDYFRIAAVTDGDLEIAATFLHEQGNVDIELLDSTDAVVASSTTQTDNEMLTASVLAGQEYTIRVFGSNLDTSLGYSLTADLPDILPDAFEENDSFATAASLPSDDQTHSNLNIHTPTDEDFFHWVSNGTGDLTIDLEFEHAAGGDIQLFVYDSNMQPVADSQSMDDNESVMIENVIVGQEFFIQVTTIPNTVGALTLEAHPDYTLTLTAPGAPSTGDFNFDGVFDCTDIDALVAVSASGNYDAEYDLNQDFRVNRFDVELWLELAGAAPDSPTGGAPFLIGDADLNGNVDGQDYVTWNINKFTSNPSWCAGDFTADGDIDGQDFIAWNGNKFTSAAGNTLVAPLRPQGTPTADNPVSGGTVAGQTVTGPKVTGPTLSGQRVADAPVIATPSSAVVTMRSLAAFPEGRRETDTRRESSEPAAVVDQVFSQQLNARWGDTL